MPSPAPVDPRAAQAVRLWRRGGTLASLAQELPAPKEDVIRWLEQAGIRALADPREKEIRKWLAVDWTRPTWVLAQRMGVSTDCVVGWRLYLNRHGLLSAGRVPNGLVRTLADYLAAGLGRIPDPEVARRLGVTASAAVSMRLRHRVPRPGRPPPAPKPPAPKPPAPKPPAPKPPAPKPERPRVPEPRRGLVRDEEGCARAAATMWRDGASVREISTHFRIDTHRVAHWLRSQEIEPRTARVQERRAALAALDWSQPDESLARTLKLAATTVARWRHRLLKQGLAQQAPPRSRWTRDELLAAGLGLDSDDVMAARLGVSRHTVARWRKRHEILAAKWRTRARPVVVPRTREELLRAGLARDPGRVVAQRLGVSESKVALWRREHGVAAPARPHTRAEFERAGIGRDIDRVVAARLGVWLDTVQRARQRWGIPAQPAPKRGMERPLAEFRKAGIGRESDQVVARRMGIARNTVWRCRVLHGIATASDGRRGRQKPGPAAR